MKTEKILIAAFFLLAALFSLNFVSATFTDTISPQVFPVTSTGTQAFNPAMCTTGQDFALQISPIGCQPAVVRSDLLSQQDAYVMCPLAATQLNPSVNLNWISSISFSGSYSPEINSVGFYPAQAALSLGTVSPLGGYGITTAQNYPVLSNIGYVVFDLKQQPNVSAMPSSVSGNLTAHLVYSAQNAAGFGSQNLYLPVLSDSQWQSQYANYGFDNGAGYIRVNSIQNTQQNLAPGSAVSFSVYDSNLNPVGQFSIQPGQTSNPFPIPGVNLCSATMQVQLIGVQNANTLAKLDVNGNVVEVENGNTFLNNQCTVTQLYPEGLASDVQVQCQTDTGVQQFDLRISPKVNITTSAGPSSYGLGDLVYSNVTATTAGDNVYLGYIGNNGQNPNDVNNDYIILVALPAPAGGAGIPKNLTDSQLQSIAQTIQQMSGASSNIAGSNQIVSTAVNGVNVVLGYSQSALQTFFTGSRSSNPAAYDKTQTFDLGNGNKFNFMFSGFANGQDTSLNAETGTYYNNAVSDFQSIISNYAGANCPSDVCASNAPVLDEQALCSQIDLAFKLGQKATLQSLCNSIEQRFPNLDQCSNMGLCNSPAVISSTSSSSAGVLIGGQTYIISLDGVYQPTFQQYGAEFIVQGPQGTLPPIGLIRNMKYSLGGNDFIQLLGLTPTSATILFNPSSAVVSNSATVNQGSSVAIGNGYTVTLEKVNLQQVAQINVQPTMNSQGSDANLSFDIPIEKPSIQLSPQQITNEIAQLNKTIGQLDAITNTTGKVVQGLQATCLATGLVLDAANFLNNVGGAGTARQMVMTNYWDKQCSLDVSQGKYSSVEQCYQANSKQIDSDVNQMTQYMNSQSTQNQKLQSQDTGSSSPLGSLFSNSVNTNQYMSDLTPQVQSCLQNYLGSSGTVSSPSSPSSTTGSQNQQPIKGASVLVSNTNYQAGTLSVTQAQNIQLYCQILSSGTASPDLKNLAQQELYSSLSDVQANVQQQQTAASLAKTTGIPGATTFALTTTQQNVKQVQISNPTPFLNSQYNNANNKGLNIPSSSYIDALKDSTNANVQYIFAFGSDGVVTGTYVVSGSNSQGPILQAQTACGNSPAAAQPNVQPAPATNPCNVHFQISTDATYNNQYLRNQGASVPEVQYFATAPYQNMPAIVPFDLKDGWYAAVQQTTSVNTASATATQAYTSAGQVQSFWLCNVGPNGVEQGIGVGDDICESINLGTGQLYNSFPGITNQNEVAMLINYAKNAIAAAAGHQNQKYVTIQGPDGSHQILVGQPTTNNPAVSCEDIMSPSQCNLLFNVCDPVVCPSSRCNFGGTYTVPDVVQTGVLGSIMLCLPNIKQGIYIPVCLTGVQAGLQNFDSVLQSYRSCLQDQLQTGQTVGVCSEVESVYMCQLLFNNLQPIAGALLPSAVSALSGQGSQGGGEYANVQNALNTAQQQYQYFTSQYANNLPAFQTGTQTFNLPNALCQISSTWSSPSGLLNQLSTPDSPPQYTGTFQEIPYTTATVPPQSQYQVYYHIYAGQNQGVYYSVYLQATQGSSYYQGNSQPLMVDSGYIDAGQSADKSPTFTGPSGYQQLCIDVNGQTNCGFQQVSTSLTVNVLQQEYVSQQAQQTTITTSSACTSGTPNLYGLANPNAQNGISNAANPQIYNYGITRICSTGNPGQGANPSNWVEVGYCDNQNVGCWLDQQSVNQTLNAPDIGAYLSNGTTQTIGAVTLSSIQNNVMGILSGSQYLSNQQFESNVTAILSEKDPQTQINMINAIINNVFFNTQKGYLLLLRGQAYSKLAEGSYNSSSISQPSLTVPAATNTGSSGSNAGEAAGNPGTTGAQGATTGTGSTQTGNVAVNGNPTGIPFGTFTASQGSSNSVTANQLVTAMNSKLVNCQCGPNCQSYASGILSAAQSYGEDPVLLLSIMITESNCEQTRTNSNGQVAVTQNGNSYGLMQVDQNSVSECSSIDSNNPPEVYNNVNNENIQCGALILNGKYEYYGKSGNPVSFPSAGSTCTDSSTGQNVSGSYTGWPAAVRGYNGYGCSGNDFYVEDVNTIYQILANIISPSASSGYTSGTASVPATGPLTTGQSIYAQYKSSFDTYSSNPPAGWSQNDFESLLIAIAAEENLLGDNSTWLMGFPQDEKSSPGYSGAVTQIQYASSVLKIAFGGDQNVNYPGYSSCYFGPGGESGAYFDSQLPCVLSVYHTGISDTAGTGFLGLSKNTAGINYANQVKSYWTQINTQLPSWKS